jgi:hypothetical protein
MARKVLKVCDLHASDVAATTSLSVQLGDDRWRADLCDEHTAQLRRTLEPLLTSAHHLGPGSPRASRQVAGSRRSRKAESMQLREWARSNGFDIGQRGRVPQAAIEAYAAQQSKPSAGKKRQAS